MEPQIVHSSTIEVKNTVEDKSTKMKQKIRCKYEDLISLAEFELDDLTDNECENASRALETIMKYGTYEDAVKAINDFITYVQFKNDIEFLDA